MNKDAVMVLEKSIGTTDQVMKECGFKMFVMVTEYTEKKQAKNIVGNGKMMFVTEKESGHMQMEEQSLEISEMINVTVYVLINLQAMKKINQ